jgi:hypothetical protein
MCVDEERIYTTRPEIIVEYISKLKNNSSRRLSLKERKVCFFWHITRASVYIRVFHHSSIAQTGCYNNMASSAGINIA